MAGAEAATKRAQAAAGQDLLACCRHVLLTPATRKRAGERRAGYFPPTNSSHDRGAGASTDAPCERMLSTACEEQIHSHVPGSELFVNASDSSFESAPRYIDEKRATHGGIFVVIAVPERTETWSRLYAETKPLVNKSAFSGDNVPG